MAEVAAGAFLSSMFQFLFERMDSPDIANFFRGRKLDITLAKKLKITMITVTGLLDHAEEKQIVVPAVKKWLDELKDAAFEADDLLDEITFEALRSELESRSWRKKVTRLLSSHNPFEMAVNAKLEKILELVEYLIRQMQALGLTLREGIGEKPSSQRTPTTSMLDDASSICGREDDSQNITKSLLLNGNGIGVICIVGSGGMGKTTLAQLIYNDKEVDGHFDLKAWVYISEEFDVFKITKDILSKISSESSKAKVLSELQEELKQELEGKITDSHNKVSAEDGKAKDIKENQQKRKQESEKKLKQEPEESIIDIILKNEISSDDTKEEDISENELKRKQPKKFLLILDDVWSDKYDEWESLLKPLRAGAPGSKIVITTRIGSIASAMETNHMKIDRLHHLERLSDSDCWSMLSKYAFDENSNSSHSDFEDVGKKIAKNCKGLPLALKTIGNLLRSKRNIEEWEKISQNNLWNLLGDDIIPALKLSYHYLSSPLKQCFAYCAMFPKGYEFYKEDLIPLWMAEGFIADTNDGDDGEDVGNAYFNDLVSRSFFQMSGGSHKCFVMHDHMHDLAKSISREFCFILEDKNSSDKVPSKSRYLYTHHGGDHYNFCNAIIEKVNDGQLLRTFFFDVNFHSSYKIMHALLPKLNYLRVLFLSKYKETKLPDSIGNLKHLRCLNLRDAWIEKLPESVSSLYNLQTLILRDCRSFIELPTNMGRLINLCYLDLRGTRLLRMPPQMGNLKKLRKLTNFVLGESSGSGIEELGKLEHIRGELSIEILKNANPKHVWKGNDHLKILEFKWSGKSDDSEQARSVLEKLRPHEKVESLCIVGYGGKTLPDWECLPNRGKTLPERVRLSNLVCLKLVECSNCSWLPSLEKLASLKELTIKGFKNVGSSFYASGSGSLIILRLERIKEWKEWQDEDGAFPHLEELYVEECPKLTKALPSNLPCLKKLQVVRCAKLLAPSLQVPPTIHEVVIEYGPSKVELKKLPSGMHRLALDKLDKFPFKQMGQIDGLLSTLEEIKLYDCAIDCLPLEFYPNLKRLESISCPDLTFFVKGESAAPNLTELSLHRCSNLKSLPKCIGAHPSLEKMEIKYCLQLELLESGCLPSKLDSLVIECCWKLKIKVIDGIGSDDEGEEEMLLLPSTLTCLSIKGLENLESLNYKRLSRLRDLSIRYCRKLRYVPDCMQALLPTLVELTIHYCPNLEPFLKGGLPSHLKSLCISGCQKAIAGLMKSDFRTMTNNKEEPMPMPDNEEMLLPSFLTSLVIQSLDNLKDLELHHLTCLNELSIGRCPKLQCITKQRLSFSLSKLTIFACPILSRQYMGEDWPYISHIPSIDITPA